MASTSNSTSPPPPPPYPPPSQPPPPPYPPPSSPPPPPPYPPPSPPPPPPSSPPPPPPSSPPPQPSLRNPVHPDLQPKTRNHLEERLSKRRRIEQSQKKSLINNFELLPHVTKILQSNDTSSLLETIQNFIEFNDSSFKIVFKSLAHHYPNAFAFKLAKLLESQPKSEIRNEIVLILLRIFKESDKLNSPMLTELKEPLLNSLKKEYNEPLLQPLCEMIGLVAARVYQYPDLGGWMQLLRYVCVCFSVGNLKLMKLNQMKGLIMLAELPEEVVENREFWLDQGNFDVVFSNLLKFMNSQNQDLQELTFNAALTVMKMSKDLERTEVCDSLLTLLLCFIELHDGGKDDLLEMVKQLENLVTLDIGKIFDGKEGDVFWCMIRVAEMEDASDELKSAAVTVIKELDEANSDGMESVVMNFSHEEVKRVFSVTMDMMSCVVDDPVWYDIDDKNCKDVGLVEDYNRGKFLLNLLSFDGDERVFVPIAFEMMAEKYAAHSDWRVRYAAMLTIAAIAEKHFKGDMVSYIHQAINIVQKSLNDKKPRVLWATMHALKCLSEYKEILKHAQYHLKFIAKLVSIIKVSLCPRVQAQAVVAIRLLVTNCGLEKIFTVGEEILVLLLELLKHEKQKLREEALDTLKPVAVLMPVIFHLNHYDTVMAALKVVLFDNSSSPNLLLRSKSLECMCTLVNNFRQDKLKEDEVFVVVETLISIERNLSNTDHLASYALLKALDQLCQCQGVEIDKFIDNIMPMLLRYAELDLDLTSRKPVDLSLDGDKHLVEKVRARALNILLCCADRSAERNSPNIEKVTNIFLRLIDCASFETRKACILALPNLLRIITKGVDDKQAIIDATHLISLSLIEALEKETNNDLSKRMFRSLPKFIQTSGIYFDSELISKMVHEINRTLKQIMDNEIERTQEAGTSEAGSDFLPTEETIKDAGFLIATTIETFKNRIVLYVDIFMMNVAEFLRIDKPDRVIALAISIFNILVPHFPQNFLKYHNEYVVTASHALRNDYPHAQLHATRAIGICAKFGKDKMDTPFVSVCLARLYDVMAKRLSISEPSDDVARLCDTAVVALGKLCEYHRDKLIEGPKVVKNWLNFLPLKHELNEARSAHRQLSRLIKESDKDLFGSENENLPTVISVVKQILSQPNLLGDQKAIDQMIEFINQHDGM